MKTWIKVITFIIIIVLLLIALQSEAAKILLSGDSGAIVELSSRSLWLLYAFTLVLMVIQNLFTLIPLLLLISVNIAIFGFTEGYLWSWALSIVGATISFYMTRYWFQNLFKRFVSGKAMERIEQSGFWFVFSGRVIPFVPTSMINIASGMSSITFRKFLYATMLGNLIYFLAMSFISQGLLSLALLNECMGLVLGAVLLVIVVVKVGRKKRKMNF